jgi:PhnB protein
MPNPIAHLAFDGNCAEAVRFYEKALGGKIEMLLDGASSPMAAEIPKEAAHRIVHARLALPGGGVLYAADTPAGMPYGGIKGASLALDYDSVAQARAIFDKLADGGQVTMAMAPTFWAKAFGMLVDRYGVTWMVNGEFLMM